MNDRIYKNIFSLKIRKHIDGEQQVIMVSLALKYVVDTKNNNDWCFSIKMNMGILVRTSMLTYVHDTSVTNMLT